jgi:hypothetical protein
MPNTAHRHGGPLARPAAAPVAEVDDVGDVDDVGPAVVVESVVTNPRGPVGSDDVAGWTARLVRA